MNKPEPDPLTPAHTGATLRFAPNFSVYILPPDAVCLYSEDRKIFLRGELYVAIAERIGAGEREQDIVGALSETFPAEKIDEAFKRLTERRYVTRALAGGVAEAYWASLGLRPETAAANLAKVRVRVQPMGGAGEVELQAALRTFGVNVVEADANLTIAVVGDYLDGRLAEFNDRQLLQKQEWLPVQPSGIFPLVGPIFSPGKSACWACLADRMQRNRQIREFLDRKQARRVSASPLGDHVLAQGATGFAAIEIAKAIASGFRTELHHQLVSLELLGSTVARHHVPRRPQCPACGSAGLRDPARVPAPTRLRVGGQSVMTSGGWRAIPPAETLNRFRKHVSPLTGVVSRLEHLKGGSPLGASFVARHNFSPRPETVEALQAGLGGESYGTGSTSEQAEVSALMKAIERTSGIFRGDEIRQTRAFADFPAGAAIAPNDVALWSEDQLAQRAATPFDPSAQLEWSPVWSVRDERFKYLPTGMLYYFHQDAGGHAMQAGSDGCAAGNTNEEAILQGFLELVARDAQAIWWYNRLRCPEVDLDRTGDSYVRDISGAFAAQGRRLWVLDVTSDLGIPVVVAVLHWTEGDQEHIEFAAGAHFDSRIAVLRAVTGLNLHLAIDRSKRRGAGQTADPLPLRSHAWLQPHGKAPSRRNPFAKFADLERRDQVRACVAHAARHKLDFLVLDQTRPDIEVPVVRVIIPSLRPLARRFAPGRLTDVPLTLGLRKRRLKEAELNPLDP